MWAGGRLGGRRVGRRNSQIDRIRQFEILPNSSNAIRPFSGLGKEPRAFVEGDPEASRGCPQRRMLLARNIAAEWPDKDMFLKKLLAMEAIALKADKNLADQPPVPNEVARKTHDDCDVITAADTLGRLMRQPG